MSFVPPSCDTDGVVEVSGTVEVSNLDEFQIVLDAETVNVESRFLTCQEDSVTVCPPVSGVFEVEVVNTVLPTGAATQVTLESLRANFATYRTNLEGRDLATNATLVQVRDYLDTVETKLQSVIDAVDGVEGVLGTTADAEAAAGNGTLIALLKNLRTRISNLETYLDGVEGAAGTTADAEASSGDGSIIALLKNLRTRLAALESISGGANVEVTQLKVMRGLTDFETRLDYDARTDGNPVYVGKALNGTLISEDIWVIQKLSYDATARLTRAQVLPGSWSGRAALGW